MPGLTAHIWQRCMCRGETTLSEADLCEGIVAPLPLLAQHWAAINIDTADACRSGPLAHGAARNHVLVHMPLRLSQSSGHGKCKRRYGESLQHGSSSLGYGGGPPKSALAAKCNPPRKFAVIF